MAYVVLGRLCAHSKCGQKLQLIKICVNVLLKKEEICFQSFLRSIGYVQNYQKYLMSGVGYRRSQKTFSTHDIDPFNLIESDLKDFYSDIVKELGQQTKNSILFSASKYYFDFPGKALRPLTMILMTRAINCHLNKSDSIQRQRLFAMAVEMAHTASLVHDDVIDMANMRRGIPSINVLWNNKQVVMAGDYIVAVAIIIATRLKFDDGIIKVSRFIIDVVIGELIQGGLTGSEKESFDRYLHKSYLKTGSLFANALKSVATLTGADEELSEIAFQYGFNIGVVYQLTDDFLDFSSTLEKRGKTTGTDLKTGLVTAPAFFACEEFPELNEMIMRRFKRAGDVEKALEMIHKSKGVEQTQLLAKKYCLEAVRLVSSIRDSPYQKALTVVPYLIFNRN